MKNQIDIHSAEHYRIQPSSKSERMEIIEYISIISGECNGKPFEGLFNRDMGIYSDLVIFSDYSNSFDRSEHQSIRLKTKRLDASNMLDYREVEPPEGYFSHYQYFFESLQLKHFGKKIFISIPYSEKDKAYHLGAKWCPTNKSWYVHDKHPNHELILNTWPQK